MSIAVSVKGCHQCTMSVELNSNLNVAMNLNAEANNIYQKKLDASTKFSTRAFAGAEG